MINIDDSTIQLNYKIINDSTMKILEDYSQQIYEKLIMTVRNFY